jgi:iron-sulfur cluster assembly accessory protein
MQTQTAYRPHSLPSSFPPPRSSGGADTSISAEFPSLDSQPTQRTSQNTAPNVSVRESEAQKSSSTFSASPAAPKTSPKPRRPLRPRKAALKLSAVATEQLRSLMDQPEPKFIRVGVKNRGCSGLAYHLEYVEKPGKFDEIVEQDGVKVLIDSKALFSIIGSEMDWHEDKLSRRFVFRNPNISKWFRTHLHPRDSKLTNPSLQRKNVAAVNLSWFKHVLKHYFHVFLVRTSRRLSYRCIGRRFQEGLGYTTTLLF